MKNIHLVPTEKPSRLWINNLLQGKLELSKEVLKGSNTAQHIYITNSEEIKEGDWLFANQGVNKIVEIKEGNYPYGSINNKGDKIFNSKHWKSKIILTTDQDLIADGVQAIDDEFLEWFVKNPSCEKVEVDESNLLNTSRTYLGVDKYKIIIPKEEPKGVIDIPKITEECGFPKEIWKPQEKPKQEYQSECICENSCRGFVNVKCKQIKKQETLEEAAEKYCLINNIPTDQMIVKNDKSCEFKTPVTMFIEGAKWQAERMYSEKIDLINWLQQSLTAKKFYSTDAEDLLEQFKKK